MTKKEILNKLSEKYSEEELESFLNEESHNEKKLSFYGLALCETVKKSLPYVSNRHIVAELMKSLQTYLKASKKL